MDGKTLILMIIAIILACYGATRCTTEMIDSRKRYDYIINLKKPLKYEIFIYEKTPDSINVTRKYYADSVFVQANNLYFEGDCGRCDLHSNSNIHNINTSGKTFEIKQIK